jgi:hypothetical protein
VALVAAGATCAMAPSAALAGTLDQQQSDIGGNVFSIATPQSLAQTFTAGASGGIDQVDLSLFKTGGNPVLPLTVQIRDVSGVAPGGTVLASQTVPATALGSSTAFVPVSFAPAAPVTAGTQYAIVAFSPVTPPPSYDWSASSTVNPYSGGAGFYTANSPPTGAWSTLASGKDLGFKTYVAPTPPAAAPSSTPTGQRAAALAKCKHKHSKQKRRKCRKRANLLPV